MTNPLKRGLLPALCHHHGPTVANIPTLFTDECNFFSCIKIGAWCGVVRDARIYRKSEDDHQFFVRWASFHYQPTKRTLVSSGTRFTIPSEFASSCFAFIGNNPSFVRCCNPVWVLARSVSPRSPVSSLFGMIEAEALAIHTSSTVLSVFWCGLFTDY